MTEKLEKPEAEAENEWSEKEVMGLWCSWSEVKKVFQEGESSQLSQIFFSRVYQNQYPVPENRTKRENIKLQ